MNGDDTFVLIVLEAGAHWPAWFDESSAETRVMAELSGEGLAGFADRVHARCEELRTRGAEPSLAIVACGDRADAAADAARRSIFRSLAELIASGEGGTILLSADRRQGGAMRQSLCDAARDIASEWENTRVVVSVRFSDERVTLRPDARRVA